MAMVKAAVAGGIFRLLSFFFFFLLCPFLPPPASCHPPLSRLLKPLRRHRHSIRFSPHSHPSLRYDVRYFTQTLDHFTFRADASTFQQRYLFNADHWSGPDALGPIFFYCGNEGDIVWFAENTGFVWELAPMFRALVVFPEHRYYGESMPFGSLEVSYKDSNTLAYLTSEQALADYVTLLRDLKHNLSAVACPVVLFGGSYGGMLAAWMRLKYPHVAIGALASSAPILQFEDLVPDDSYYKVVSEDFKQESSECFEVIRSVWDKLRVAGQTDDGLLSLSNQFHLCNVLNSTTDLEDWIFSALSYLAMVNYPYAADFIMPLPAYPIKEVCNAINADANADNILSRVFAGMNVFYNYSGSATCFETDDDDHDMFGWYWQACTEMVMPMSSNPNNSMFPPGVFDMKQYEDYCMEQFGVKPRSTWITSEFGGHNIEETLKNFGSNIVFSNGLLDPWSRGGVLQNISNTIVAVVTNKGAHHLDLRFSTDNDPDWLIEQRRIEVEHIKSWLYQYYADRQIGAAIELTRKSEPCL